MAHPHHPEHHTGHTPEMHDAPDAWHRHTADEGHPQAAHGEIANPAAVIFIGVASFLFVVVAGLAVYLYYVAYTVRLLDERERTGPEGVAIAEKRDAMERLTRGYVWADEERGLVQLPMDIAKRRVIEEYTGRARRGDAR